MVGVGVGVEGGGAVELWLVLVVSAKGWINRRFS